MLGARAGQYPPVANIGAMAAMLNLACGEIGAIAATTGRPCRSGAEAVGESFVAV